MSAWHVEAEDILAVVNDAMNSDFSKKQNKTKKNNTILLLPVQKHTFFWPSNKSTRQCFKAVVCLLGASPPALYLCYPVRRWCHSWGEAMIKILLSLSR